MIDETVMTRQERREFRSAAWFLLHAGFLTLSYDRDGKERFKIHPDAEYTEEDVDKVQKAFVDAGVNGATCEEIAKHLNMPLVRVKAIVGEV